MALQKLLLLASLVTSSGYQNYVNLVPNGAKVPNCQGFGHTSCGGGGSRSQFGKDFDSAGNGWSMVNCPKDSDGDGQTNGEELGDPCCTWTPGATPKGNLIFPGFVPSNPNDAGSKVSYNRALYNCTTPAAVAAANNIAAPSLIAVMLVLSLAQ